MNEWGELVKEWVNEYSEKWLNEWMNGESRWIHKGMKEWREQVDEKMTELCE